ncbi:MAG: MFS transporter [Promicromonosporaceae bacterium]|nr:MFS transporter [Promicromonosporaceae bacterium]
MEDQEAPLFPRAVVLGAFLPTLAFSTGVGALLPVIVPAATHLGANLATAGVMASLLSVGTIIADLPAGEIASKIGDRWAMLWAGLLAAGAFALAAWAPNLWLLGAAIILLGVAGAVFGLARHSYLTEITPPLRRARVLSTLGGVHRVGNFLGPFIGAPIIYLWGPTAALWLGVALSVAAAINVLLVKDDAPHLPAPTPAEAVGLTGHAPNKPTIKTVFVDHRQLFFTLGLACLLIGAVRGARNTVIPMWAEHLGIENSTTSLIVGVAGAVDMLLFYPAGKLMDKLGRNWVAIPSMLVMGVALFLLPLTAGVVTVGVVAMLLGLGNGVSSGILMTLGSDASPAHGRAQFLGLWRLLQDTGSAAGPLLVSAGAALGSLAAGVWAAGALGPVAAGALHRWVPRWTVHASRRTRRAAGITT